MHTKFWFIYCGVLGFYLCAELFSTGTGSGCDTSGDLQTVG